MLGVFLEVIQLVILLITTTWLWILVFQDNHHPHQGHYFIFIGFCLLLISSLFGITDNFLSLDWLATVGDIKVESYIQKNIGFLAGFIFLAIGLMKLLPEMDRLKKGALVQKKSEEDMHLLSEITKNIAEGINLVRSEDNIIVYVNKKFEQMFGYECGELIGKHVSIINAPNSQSPEDIANEITSCLVEKGAWCGELVNKKKDGTYFWTTSVISEFQHTEYGPVYLTAQRDTSLQKEMELELKQLNRQLKQHSYQDGLTDIANRRMFDETLEKEWRRAIREQEPLSLIMIDIDCFKQYNDHYGHIKGDSCLKEIAQQLSNITKRTADLCARYGGEEFIILLPNTSNNVASILAKECCEKTIELGITHEYSDVIDIITISAGVSTLIPTVESVSHALVNAADTALYQAKDNGRNRVESI